MQTTFIVIDGEGHTLRADAAGSYLRMLKKGMPAGGIDVFQRTLDDQWAVWNHFVKYGSPLAAYPSLTAPHVRQMAFDTHTTTAGKYAPSAAHLWLTSGGDGSKAPRDTNDKNIQAHKFGWSRTVPSERWHFGYDAKADQFRVADLNARVAALGYKTVKEFQAAHKLAADGVDGPLTWGALLLNPIPKEDPTVPPVVTPPSPAAVVFDVFDLNMEAKRFGGGRYVDDAKFIAGTLTPTPVFIGFTQESDGSARDQVRKYNDGLKVWPLNYLGVYWQDKYFKHGPKIPLTFDNKGVHGMVGVELTDENGASFVAASVHIRPTDAFGGDVAKAKVGKKADIDKVIAKLAKYDRVVVGGDWSSDAKKQMEAAGYTLATPYVDTYDKPDAQKLDAVFVRGIEVRGGSVYPTTASDHHGLKATLANPLTN